jgi:hypothetical protein
MIDMTQPHHLTTAAEQAILEPVCRTISLTLPTYLDDGLASRVR